MTPIEPHSTINQSAAANVMRSCENCNAPRKDAVAIMLRCWRCVATNDARYATLWLAAKPVAQPHNNSKAQNE